MDAKQERRIEVLLEWRRRARDRGHTVPTEDDTIRIAESGAVFPEGVDLAAAEPWRPTVTRLFRLLRRDMPDPLSMLTEDLWEPVAQREQPRPGPAADTVPGGAPPSPLQAALLDWYHAEPAAAPRRAGLGVSEIQAIARVAAKEPLSVDGIRLRLPKGLRHLAEEIAEIIARHPSAGHRPSGGATAPPRTEAPRSTAPPGPPPGHGAYAAAEPEDERGPFDHLTLADHHFTGEQPAPAPLGVEDLGTDGYRYTWTKAAVGSDRPTVIYRVVSTDGDYPPESPQHAAELARTDAVECPDRRLFAAALRHVQVWYHAGATPAEAAASRPVLHAEGWLIAQIHALEVNLERGSPFGRSVGGVGADAQKVVGAWDDLPGTARVRIERAERMQTGGPLEFAEIHPTRPNSVGFEDTTVVAGRSYRYRFALVVRIDGGQQMSTYTVRTVDVPVPLVPVRDMKVVRMGADGVDLCWTPVHPSLKVRIYRTGTNPWPAMGADPIPLRALGEVESRTTWLNYPVELRDGKAWMTKVGWPDSAHAYFTPVTVQGDQARVGTGDMRVNLPPVTDVRVVERVFKQVLTFTWPEGAVSVAVARMPRYTDGREPTPEAVRAALAETNEHIAAYDYRRDGGKAFFRLGGEGCRLYLEPESLNATHRYTGEPVHHDYPGLIRLKYGLHVRRDADRRPESVYLTIVAERAGVENLHFSLLHHPRRLPLHIGDQDCQPVRMWPTGPGFDGVGADQFRTGPLPKHTDAGPAAWMGSVAGLAGYLRLFIRDRTYDDTPVALLDPPIGQLRLDLPDGVAP